MKRNKAIILVATACVAAGALVALAACEAPPEHEHTYDNGTVTVAATCTQNGEKLSSAQVATILILKSLPR